MAQFKDIKGLLTLRSADGLSSVVIDLNGAKVPDGSEDIAPYIGKLVADGIVSVTNVKVIENLKQQVELLKQAALKPVAPVVVPSFSIPEEEHSKKSKRSRE